MTFGFNPGLFVVTALLVLIVGIAILSYWRTTKPLSSTWKFILITFRTLSLALLAFLLFEPGVMISKVKPQETYVAVVVDDSASMAIKDDPLLPSRQQQTLQFLYDKNILDELSENFQVRSYRFSEIAARAGARADFKAQGDQSALGRSIEQVAAELSGYPVAGLVILSDGADNGDVDPLSSAGKLVEKQIPVFTVGVGAENIERDVHIQQVSAAKSLLEDSVYTVDVSFSQIGYAGKNAQLKIYANDKEVVSRQIRFGDSGTSQRQTLELNPSVQDILVYRLAIEKQPGETILENNEANFFVDNREREPLDVLYIEGQPRNEYKFIRRAIKDDRSLRLATYLQTGPRKFLRQGIEAPDELENGFPLTKEDLYGYEAIILGNVERSFFNEKQLLMLQDFVAERGAGFLLLGGIQESFIDSPVAAVLPVELQRENSLPGYLQGGARRGDHPTGQTYPATLTKDGEFSPILRLATDDQKNRSVWREMPMLEGVYVSGLAKPGATVLMEHPNLSLRNKPLPILSVQRYGAGRSMALATASTWRWQMLQSHKDQSHERVWRQLLRWLSFEAPQRLTLSLDKDQYHPGDDVVLTAYLLDETFEPANDGLLWVTIKSPNEPEREIPLQWQIDKEGAYQATFKVPSTGVYDLAVTVPSEITTELAAQLPVLVTPSNREYVNPELDSGLLKRISVLTGGEYFPIDEADQLMEKLTYSANAYSTQEIQSLWDKPFFFVLLLILVAGEWLLRRIKGLS